MVVGVCLALLLSIRLTQPAFAVNIFLPTNFKTCVNELVPKSLVTGEYHIEELHARVTVEIKIRDNHENVLYHAKNAQTGVIGFSTTQHGPLIICFDVVGGDYGKLIPAKLHLQWTTTKKDEAEKDNTTKDEKPHSLFHNEVVFSKMAILQDYITEIVAIFKKLNVREMEFGDIFDRSANTVIRITVFLAVATLVVCFIEYRCIKKFLLRKKII